MLRHSNESSSITAEIIEKKFNQFLLLNESHYNTIVIEEFTFRKELKIIDRVRNAVKIKIKAGQCS
jgi:hypothetical protein